MNQILCLFPFCHSVSTPLLLAPVALHTRSEHGKISTGKNCKFGDNVHVVCSNSISLGDDCLLASNIFISDTNHGDGNENPLTPPDKRSLSSNPVIIGNCVWIGEGVCILPGTVIGDGCTIGAHSVVKGNIPPHSIVVGAPAKAVKKYNFKTNTWERC